MEVHHITIPLVLLVFFGWFVYMTSDKRLKYLKEQQKKQEQTLKKWRRKQALLYSIRKGRNILGFGS
jgi:hypothetical protein